MGIISLLCWVSIYGRFTYKFGNLFVYLIRAMGIIPLWYLVVGTHGSLFWAYFWKIQSFDETGSV